MPPKATSSQVKRKPRRRKPATPKIRDRVVELRRVATSELLDNDKNWRVHPYAQRQVIAESLDRIGISDALIAYHSKRAGGKLTLIDGHARREDHAGEWPVLILDVNDEEADELLLTLDPSTAMAEANGEALRTLIEEQGGTGTPALEDLLRELHVQANEALRKAAQDDIEQEEDGLGGPPEMELQTFESYDYIIVLFRSSLDWSQAKDKLNLGPAAFTLKDGKTRKIGLGRVFDGAKLLELLK